VYATAGLGGTKIYKANIIDQQGNAGGVLRFNEIKGLKLKKTHIFWHCSPSHDVLLKKPRKVRR
jgi:hypothetical protein